MTKKIGPGAEIDGWCTKCKMDLLHRIIAMVGDTPKRAECLTCRTDHNYHKPKTSPAAVTRPAAAKKSPTEKRPVGSASARAVAAQKAEQSRERTWEKLVSGHAVTDFRPYRPALVFTEGELIRHAKFGDGYVQRVIDKNKVEAMFREGPRTLAHGLVPTLRRRTVRGPRLLGGPGARGRRARPRAQRGVRSDVRRRAPARRQVAETRRVSR
jgi:hypothetical protein